jgi:hypothetical protein
MNLKKNLSTVQLVTLGLLVSFLWTSVANAAPLYRGRFSLPYEVRWVHTVLPAGEYQLRFEDVQMRVFRLLVHVVTATGLWLVEPDGNLIHVFTSNDWINKIEKATQQKYVCSTGYALKQCNEEMVVLKKALANYPTSDLGEWTWVLVRSEYWKLILTTQTLNPGIPALTDTAARATFFDEALVTGTSGRMSELMALWHMGRESLLDFAIRHELGHALCNDASEINADRVARLLEQKKPISCRAKVTAKRDKQSTKSSFP